MARICSNCGSKQGPFSTSWSHLNIPICKNTKKQPNRVTACVEKRASKDAEKFKELLHPYS